MRALLVRFSEPSSYAGLAGILAVAHMSIPDGIVQSATFILAGVCGVVAFLIPEKKA